MRLATWNVNGIRACWGQGLSDFLQRERPEVLGVQEVKCGLAELPSEVREPPGYRTLWHVSGRAGYSGVGMFVRQDVWKEGLWSVAGLGCPEIDQEGRVLTLELPDQFFVTCYFPNSGPGGRRLSYKLSFCRLLERFLGHLHARGKPILLAGDLNIAAQDLDVHCPRSAAGEPGFLTAERSWLQGFLEGPWVDVFRRDHPDEPGHYTWWSYFDDDRAKNRGWRIDSFLVTAELAPRVRCEIRPLVLGSDHCPVVATLPGAGAEG